MASSTFKHLNLQPTPISTIPRPFNRLTISQLIGPHVLTNTFIHLYVNTLLFGKRKKKFVGLQFKIKSIKLWCVSGDSISCEVYDLFNQQVADVLVSHPGANQWAKIGIEWPLAQQQKVIISTGIFTTLAELFSNNQSAKIYMQMTIHWRTEPLLPSAIYKLVCPLLQEDEDMESNGFEIIHLEDVSDSEDALM